MYKLKIHKIITLVVRQWRSYEVLVTFCTCPIARGSSITMATVLRPIQASAGFLSRCTYFEDVVGTCISVTEL